MAVLALGEEQTRKEGAERHRQAGLGGEPAGAEHHEQGRRDEQLRAAGAGDRMQHRAQDEAPGEQDRGQRQDRLEQRDRERGGDRGRIEREHRHQDQERHHGKILEQQDREGGAPGDGDLLAALDEQLQHEGRRRQREPAADDDRGRHVHAQGPRERGDQRGREQHLRGAEPEHEAAHDAQPLERQLEADREQEERDPELCQHLRRRRLGDQPERLGADQRAGREIAEDRADPQAPEQRHDHDRREKEDQKVPEDVGLGHRLAGTRVACGTLARRTARRMMQINLRGGGSGRTGGDSRLRPASIGASCARVAPSLAESAAQPANARLTSRGEAGWPRI